MRRGVVVAYHKIPALADDQTGPNNECAIGLIALAHRLITQSASVRQKSRLGSV
jgi:hypothetical protein